jgi:hypothetical protein
MQVMFTLAITCVLGVASPITIQVGPNIRVSLGCNCPRPR